MANKQKDETDDKRLFYRISSRAFMYDKKIVYTGEQLMLALLLHAKGKRTKDQTDFVKGLMNDPNQDKRKPRKPRQ